MYFLEWLYECLPFIPVLLASLMDTRLCCLKVCAIYVNGYFGRKPAKRIVILVEAKHCSEMCNFLAARFYGCSFSHTQPFCYDHRHLVLESLRAVVPFSVVYERVHPRYPSALSVLNDLHEALGIKPKHYGEVIWRSGY